MFMNVNIFIHVDIYIHRYIYNEKSNKFTKILNVQNLNENTFKTPTNIVHSSSSNFRFDVNGSIMFFCV
jgi:hypothetical protein